MAPRGYGLLGLHACRGWLLRVQSTPRGSTAGIPVSRDCLLCGAMICGCKFHMSPDSMATLYGICRSCVDGITVRAGEMTVHDADEATRRIAHAPKATRRRAVAYLDSLQKERAS